MKHILSFILSFLLLLSVYMGLFTYTYAAVCPGPDCITSEEFKISVGAITPGGTSMISSVTDGTVGTQNTVSNFLTTVLEKLIIIFGVLSIFIMTIGAGYMIIYHGQDEFLSKGKSIFVSGLIALAVALSAGVIVRVFAYLLYSTT